MGLLSGKRILIGITGGIAVYKIAELVRLLVKADASVTVIMTDSATQFVNPLTFSTLSRNKVYTDLFIKPDEYDIGHINLADSADLMLIAPATANIIGKIAYGIADDLLSTTVMALDIPVMIAPAMNVKMWNNPVLQENILKLSNRGYTVLEPDEGELACGYSGTGRLMDVESIFQAVTDHFTKSQFLKGKKVLVSLGGTREKIDPVRYITNKSSGKMGMAIINEAVNLGASVTAVSTVSVNCNCVETYMVESAMDMEKALLKLFHDTDILVMAAAVADFTVKTCEPSKIKKKDGQDSYNLELVKTTDILASLGMIKSPKQLLVGFAAETENLITNAQKKLQSKNLDLIVANDVSRNDTGMNSDFNEVTFIHSDGSQQFLSKTTKCKVAKELFKILNKYL